MAGELQAKLLARIAHLDAEIERVTKNAHEEIRRLKGQKALLVQAQGHLTPERAQLLETLRAQGVL